MAGAAGPTLGAFVVEHFGWRWAFFINLPVGIVSVMLAAGSCRKVASRTRAGCPTPLGVVLLATGLALPPYAIVKTAVWGWGSVGFLAT